MMSTKTIDQVVKVRARRALARLKRIYPDVHCALTFDTPFQLLVAVMLSAQCTDKKVNEVTPKLFARFASVDEFADARLADIERIIRPTGFFRMKAKHVKEAAIVVRDRYAGTLPQTIDELISIPGVGRKTANVVLGEIFGIADGVVVDTHVRRLARVLGLTRSSNVAVIERELMVLYPKREWVGLSHRLIQYGREYCPAHKHDHARCPLGHVEDESYPS